MRRARLQHQVQYLSLYHQNPKAILIHLGSNDLTSQKSVEIRHAMKADIISLFKTFTNTKIIVSALLPRLIWRSKIPIILLEKKRKAINKFVRRLVEHEGGIFIRHDDISVDTPGLYFQDGVHLSDVGNDLFILGITDALERALSN